ncbi:MAG: energy transducer TonB [Bacteroidales bacterium]
MKIKSFLGAIILVIAMFFSFGAYSQEGIVADQIDTPAQMPLGKQALSDFIYANTVYPANAVGSGISGMVMTKFIVEVNGTISNIQVERGLNPIIDAEAIRVIGLIPGQFVPATFEGVNVRSYYFMPVLFSDPAQ